MTFGVKATLVLVQGPFALAVLDVHKVLTANMQRINALCLSGRGMSICSASLGGLG